MTRTSPDVRFRRAFLVVVVVLALACAALVVAARTQGPKLSHTVVDASALTAQTDQAARLFFNEQVAHVARSQVTVSPAVPFSVTTAGTIVTIQFTGRLNYASPYTVHVRGVSSVFDSRGTDVRTSFTTAHASVLTLERSPGGQDQIIRASVDAVGRDIVYRGPRIQAFAALGDDLVVVSDDRHTSSMVIVSPDGTREDLALPAPGLVAGFSLNAPTGILLFSFVPTSISHADPGIYEIDLSGTHVPVHVAKPTAVQRASLSAGPEGEGSGTARLSSDGHHIVDGSRTLYSAPSDARLSQLGSSPNGQFLTVVSAPPSAPSDGYTIAPAPTASTVLVVDSSSGVVVASFAGSALRW